MHACIIRATAALTCSLLVQEAAQLPDTKVEANFADELFEKLIGLPIDQQEEGYVAPHTLLQVCLDVGSHTGCMT